MSVLTGEQRLILDRHLAVLEADARSMDVVAALFRPEFEACWERKEDGSMGALLDGERANQLRTFVIDGPRNARYNRDLADAIQALLP